MISVETHRPEIAGAIKSSIMRRYELAKAKPKGANCHDAAYYLLGIKPREYSLGEVCYVDFSVFEATDDLDEAVLIAFGVFGDVYENKSLAIHLAILHPFDRTKVIHRDVVGYYETRRSHHNFFTGIADIIEEFTVGLNPMRIEPLKDVQKRWSLFSMRLFSLKSECYEKVLSQLVVRKANEDPERILS